MASLTDLAKQVRNTKNRQSQAFLRVWDSGSSSYEFRNVGRIMDSSFNSEPVASDADQDGRESSQLFDITVSFTMMQAANEELSLLTDLALPTDATNYPNGHSLYFSGDNQLSTTELNSALNGDNEPDYTVLGDDSSEPADPNGFYFKNVLLKPSAEIDLSGETSMLPIEFTGRVPLDVFLDFDDDSVEDGNHINISPT